MTSTSSTCPSGIVREHDLQRPEHRHDPRRAPIEIFAHTVLELRDVDHVLLLGDTDAAAEIANRLRRMAAAPEPADRRHPRIVPPRHDTLLHELQQLSLAHHRVVQIQARELDLPRTIGVDQIVDEPVVERPVILEFERAQGVGDPLEGVGQGMREIVHRVDAPRIARAVMRRMADAVERRIPHVQIRRRHVDLRAQHVRPVRKLSRRACAQTDRGSPRWAGRGTDCCVPAPSTCRDVAGSLPRGGCRRRPGRAG